MHHRPALHPLSFAAWVWPNDGPKRRSRRPSAFILLLRTGEEQQIFLARSRQIDLQLRQTRQRGLGRDFESLRDYREGDDMRDICWTASARRGNLITRQYQTERSQPVWIVLDCGRLMRSRVVAAPGIKAAMPLAPGSLREHSKLDHACTAAVALAQLALFSGDRVGLLAYGQTIQQRLLPGRGAAHLRQMIELLAQLRAESSEADHLRATTLLGRLQPRRSLILWITDLAETAMRPEVIDGAMHLLRRHVLLFVAMAQPEVDAIAQASSEECRGDVSRRRRAGDGRPPRIADCAPARAGRTHSRPQSRSSNIISSESVPDGEGTRDGVAADCRDTKSLQHLHVCGRPSRSLLTLPVCCRLHVFDVDLHAVDLHVCCRLHLFAVDLHV